MTRERAVRKIEQAINEQLMELNLSRLNLEELPPEIVRCTYLTKLDLGNNEITFIPEAIGQLSNLTGLHLDNN
ncbi:hypothetical protein [Microcoleus sp. S13C4]|uniref:hypothetical protein n=1 Tax=Microcoleus sp. S13C4 TaxID=3055410 RepID=UPI002FD56342